MAHPPERLQAALADRYAIHGEIGSGGMARVYRGRDLKHERDVAIKVLRPELAAVLGPDRFLREIRIAAQLQHPHILQLYDSGEAEGLLYYIMPLIEGESLRERIARDGELPIGDATRILRDVADALAHAHERGLVHRDIKPDNVLLYGRHAVVTDFGVAKALTSSTTASDLTSAGIALGTPAYMAPEQASGHPNVDHRADIYAFGAMAYEMLSGRPPFSGETPQQVLAKQVTEAPEPLTDRRDTVPPGIAGLVMHCLQKAPADRWQTMDEVLYQLEVLATPSGGMTPTSARLSTAPSPVASRRTFIGGVVAVAALGIFGAVSLLKGGGPGPVTPPVQRQVTFVGSVLLSEVSPDGEFLAYSTATDSGAGVYVRDLEGGSRVTLVTGWRWVVAIRWNPDSKRVFVGGGDENGEYVHLVFPRLGGEATPIVSFGSLMSWSVDGGQRFQWGANFVGFNIDSREQDVRTFVALPDTAGWLVDVEQNPTNPDVFAARKIRATGSKTIVYRVVVDSLRRWTESYDTVARRFDPIDEPEVLLSDEALLYSVRWAPDGKALFYLREEGHALDIWMLPVDDDARPAGDAVLVMSGIEAMSTEESEPVMSFTDDGKRLFLTKGRTISHLWEVARNGSGGWTPLQLTAGTAVNEVPQVSPDGTRLAFVRVEAGRSNVFVMPWGGGPARQVTHNDSVVGDVVWSPNGGVLAFGVRRGGGNRIATVSVDRPASVRVFEDTELSANGTIEWAPGQDLLYQRPGVRQFHVLDPRTGEERPLFPPDTARLGWPLSIAYSPAADKLAVGWNRSNQRNNGLWVVSLADSVYTRKQAGGNPVVLGWTTDGTAVFTLYTNQREIWRVPMEGEPEMILSSLPFSPSFIGTTDGSSFVLGQANTVGDVWVIENFDPRGR